MEKVRVGDIATLINGDRGKNYPSQADITDEGDIPFVNAGHLNGRNIDFEEMNYISQDKYKRLSSGKFVKGDVLYCLRGSLGKKAIVNDDVEGAIASSLVIIRPNYDRIDGDYLMFSLDSPSIKEQLNKANNGSSQPNLSAASVREYQIELPDLKKQKDIVKKLVKTRSIIDSRQHEIDLLDELIKARFVELTERANTIPTRMGDIATYVNGYAFKPEQWEDNGYPIIRIQNLNDANAPYNYYSGDLAEKYLIHNGDVLVSWATHLEAYIWKGREAWLNQHIFKAVFDKMYVDKTYYVYACEEALRQAFRNAHGFKPTMEHIKKSDFDAAIVRLPDIETQKEFADFVNQVDKSKFVVQKSLEEALLLFDSLMQEYFG